MKTKPKKPTLRAKWRRFILSVSLLLSLIVGAIVYSELHGITQNRAGRVAVWSAGKVVAPLINSVPWWGWCLVAGYALWMWTKHKIMMSMVLVSLLAGVLAL